ncbi:MAG: hypothetical protein ACE5IE_00815 [Dehalococcoidia bacterium]
MGSVLKALIFVALLVGAGAFLGLVLGMIGDHYGLLFSPSIDLLYLGLWFLGALVAVAVTAGLAAMLLRPFSLIAIAFALSAVGMFAAWELSAVSGIVAAIYLAVGLLFAWSVTSEIKSRVKFSVWHILKSQAILLVVLTAIGCTSLYFAYADQIQSEGFTLPPVISDVITDAMEGQGVPPSLIEAFEQQIEDTLAPYERYIPIGVAAIVFMPLMSIVIFLSWIPILILAAVLPLLTRFGVVEEVTDTIEVTRLNME